MSYRIVEGNTGKGKIKNALYSLLPDLRAVRERPLFPICVYLMLGIAAGPWLPWLPAAGFAVFFGLLLLCAFLFALKKDIALLIMVTAFAAGWALFGAALPGWAADPWAPAGQVEVSGAIADTGLTSGGHACYVLDGVTVDGKPVEGRVALTERGSQSQGAPGDRLTASVELARPDPSGWYGGFNARGWYMRQGIRFTAFAAEVKVTPSGRGTSILDLPEQARQYADDVLKKYLKPENAAFADALLSGDTSDISPEDRDAFRDLGIAHLLAVSGLNISLTAGAVWLLCRKLRLPLPVSLGLSFLTLCAYALFAGLTPSVLRAAAMWAAMMGGLAAARRYDPVSSISAAAIAILLLNPLDLFDAGFQLSFAATAAIFLWFAPLSRYAPRNRALKFFFDSAGLTVCATLLALPVILSCFNQISPVSPLANLVLVPASFILQLGATALLFVGFIPGAAGLLGGAVDWYASLYLRNVSILDWTSSPLHAATPPLWLAAAFALAALMLSPAFARMAKPGRIAAAVTVALSAALMLSPVSQALTWRSDAAVVSEGNSALSVWWRADGKDYAACGQDWSELAGYLRSRGVSRLAGLYVLRSSPPDDGSLLLEGDGISADALYVPESWLSNPGAADFLGQGILLGMKPEPAEAGPFALYESKASAALEVPAGGGTIAFAPYASVSDFTALRPEIEAADAAALSVSASRAERLLGGMAPRCAIVPGEVEGLGCPAYNSAVSGSIEAEWTGGGLLLAPWREGWADGIQGNFR